jgi:hypothetical protein
MSDRTELSREEFLAIAKYPAFYRALLDDGMPRAEALERLVDHMKLGDSRAAGENRGGWSSMKADNEPVDDIGMHVITAYPQAFRALVNECALAAPTAIAVLHRHRARQIDARRKNLLNRVGAIAVFAGLGMGWAMLNNWREDRPLWGGPTEAQRACKAAVEARARKDIVGAIGFLNLTKEELFEGEESLFWRLAAQAEAENGKKK